MTRPSAGAATPGAAPGSAPEPWHALPLAALWPRLECSPDGLRTEEAERRLARHGPNELQVGPGISPLAILLAQFRNVLIVILLIATALSALLGHGVESVAITVIVLFAVLLGFVQEYRAEQALAALRRLAAPVATAVRDGREVEIEAPRLVPGDVVILRAGNRVPADARLLEAVNLEVQEAALTGESAPAAKRATEPDPAAAAIGDRHGMVHAGTLVSYGRGRALVVATGMSSEFGRIAAMLASVEVARTPLQKGLDRLGATLARAALAVVALIAVLGIARGQPPLEMLVFAIALAVAVVPEVLPAVVTISLALGVQRLVSRRALMRRLPAAETLGSTSVICSDKTGTLTRDEMTARRLWVAGQYVEITGVGYAPVGEFRVGGEQVEPSPELRLLLRAAALASDAELLELPGTGRFELKGDPTEGALVVAAAKAGLRKSELERESPRVAEIPFASETRRMTTLNAAGAGTDAHAKGAPEVILECCSRQLAAGGERALDAESRQAILAAARHMASEAMRVLAVASKVGAGRADAERDLTFLGLVGMIDPPRPEARDAVLTCERAGIRVVMLTGDHPATAEAVARELGLLGQARLATGAELAAMSDDDLLAAVEEIGVYARVSPEHKLRVVTALQRRGHVVAVTGDGVNDAPALRKADIGIAMGQSGTDVAREAAAMTLTDDNFASIVAAVEEGRGIFANIKKYLMFLLSSNVGEIGLVAGATLLGLPLPLTAVQILYVNLATDGLPALALAVDPPEPDLMLRKPRDPRHGIFTRPVVMLMAAGGLWSMLVNLGLFAWALGSGRPVAEAMTMTFVSLVLIQFVKAYAFRSDRRSTLLRPFANRWLNRAVMWELLLLALVVHLPVLHAPFGTLSLSGSDWAIAILAAGSIAPVLELAKWMVRRGWFGALS